MNNNKNKEKMNKINKTSFADNYGKDKYVKELIEYRRQQKQIKNK